MRQKSRKTGERVSFVPPWARPFFEDSDSVSVTQSVNRVLQRPRLCERGRYSATTGTGSGTATSHLRLRPDLSY